MLIIGSELRCPVGVWSNSLREIAKGQSAEQPAYFDEPLAVRSGSKSALPEGFRRTMTVSASAYRVPFDSFAAEIETSFGKKISPLELICRASETTRDFTVFGSNTVQHLLKYKWHGFAFRRFCRKGGAGL